MKFFIQVHERTTAGSGELSLLRYIRALDVLGLRIKPSGEHQLQFWELTGGTEFKSTWITIDESIDAVARQLQDALDQRCALYPGQVIDNPGII